MRRRKFNFYSAKTLKKVIEKYAVFSSSATYVTTPFGKGWDPSTTPRSFSFWLKPYTTSGTQMIFSHNWIGSNRLYVSVNSSQWQLGIQAGGTNATGTTNRPAQNVWSFVVVVFDGANAKLYAQGSLMLTVPYTPFVTDSNMTIGNRGDATGTFPLNGVLDDFAVYDKAFTDAEVTQLTGSNPTVFAPNLLAYYKFDGDSLDSSGKDNHGTAVGVTYENRKRIYAAFDGVNDYIAVPNNALLQLTGDMTIEFWMNQPTAGVKHLISKANGGEFGVQIGGGNRVIFSQGNGLNISGSGTANGNYQGHDSVYVPAVNQWVHVAIVRKVATPAVTFYFNGLAGRTVSSTVLPAATNIPLTIGGNGGLGGSIAAYMNGMLREVRIWNTARTLAEIQANLNVSFTTPQPGLVAYYKLNGDAADSSGNDLNGTAYNGMSFTEGNI